MSFSAVIRSIRPWANHINGFLPTTPPLCCTSLGSLIMCTMASLLDCSYSSFGRLLGFISEPKLPDSFSSYYPSRRKPFRSSRHCPNEDIMPLPCEWHLLN